MDQQILDLWASGEEETAITTVSEFSVKCGDYAYSEYYKFFGNLFVKYMDGTVKTVSDTTVNPKVASPGYPDAWYNEIVDATGDHFLVTDDTQKSSSLYKHIHSKPNHKKNVKGVF